MGVSRWGWIVSTVVLGAGLALFSSEAGAQAKPDPELEPPALEGPVAGDQATPAQPDAEPPARPDAEPPARPDAEPPARPDVEPPARPDSDSEPEAGVDETEINAPLHDALRLKESGGSGTQDNRGGDRAENERAPKSPPPPVAERPSTDRPDPQARWFGGYWSWDAKRGDFVWVSGAWRVPPADSIWVEGRWRRDAEGWYRVPGIWSKRRIAEQKQNRDVPLALNNNEEAEGWRVNGPPVDRPAESPGPAPGPNFFYVPGQYVPKGEQTEWKSGFWAQVQPGWDWVPARWVQQAEGWQYREGYWTRDTGPRSANPRRHSVARPSDLPPAIVESEPSATSPDDPDNLPAPGTDPDRDVIAGAEKDAEGRARVAPGTLPPPVVVDPRGIYVPLDPPIVGYGYRSGMPYRMIRPPSPLYGPRGVVVPDAVPPFVQRLMNRVLP